MNSSFVQIHPPLLDHLGKYLLLTANERMAREYRTAYDAGMQAHGKRAWPTLSCMSLRRFVLNQFELLQDAGYSAKLLTQPQLYLRFQNAAPEHGEYLSQSALDAWRNVRRYGVDLDSAEMNGSRTRLFTTWCRRVEAQMADNELIEEDIAALLIKERPHQPRPILIVELEQLAPAEKNLLEQLDASTTDLHHIAHDGQIQPFDAQTLLRTKTMFGIDQHQVSAYDSPQDELAAAAEWAKAIAQNEPNARIGIVVPDLTARYEVVKRQFAMTLDPWSDSLSAAFDISGGKPLNQTPVWQHANDVLRWSAHTADQAALIPLVNSEFLKLTPLAALLSQWPRSLRRQITPAEAIGAVWKQGDSDACESEEQIQLTELSEQWLTNCANLRQPRPFRDWLTHITQILKSVGWPNIGALKSIQFQATQQISAVFEQLQRWPEEHRSAQSFLSYDEALSVINYALAQEVFGAQRQSSPIQILGLLETTGLRFSHLRVCGLSADNFPGKVTLNPFLPRHVALKYGIPRSSQEQELAFSQRLLAHWQHCTEHLQLSYSPPKSGEECLPSPLISALFVGGADSSKLKNEQNNQGTMSHSSNRQVAVKRDGLMLGAVTALSHRHPLMRTQNVPLLERSDHRAPTMSAGQAQGGTQRLATFADCPFKEAAIYRFGLNNPVASRDYLDHMERGSVLHDILAALLGAHRDQEAILQISEQEIYATAKQKLSVFRHLPDSYIEQEAQRLVALVQAWCELEADRSPFQVLHVEEDFDLNLGALTFSMRIDRVDKVLAEPHQPHIVIDYKTGQIESQKPDAAASNAPQLPAYSAFSEKIEGTYYAKVKKDDLRLQGLGARATLLADKKVTRLKTIEPIDSWQARRAAWQQELIELSQAMYEGHIIATPSAKACQHCHLRRLCRAQEQLTGKTTGEFGQDHENPTWPAEQAP